MTTFTIPGPPVPTVAIYYGDAWELALQLEPESIDCIVTSPPYWGLRDYGHPGQFGLEATLQEYVAKLVELFSRLRPALKSTGTVWLNLGDSYGANWRGGPSSNASAKQASNRGTTAFMQRSGQASKNLLGIPWQVALALREDGWYLRSDIIWHKPNPMPESVRDRPTKSHEYVFLLTKSSRYYYDQEAVAEPARRRGEIVDYTGGQKNNAADKKFMPTRPRERSMLVHDKRNIRSVWTIATEGYNGAHFAVMPQELARRCILAGCPEGGLVLDPFAGSGTTLAMARRLGRHSIGFELNEEYRPLIEQRLAQGVLL